jgi:Uma2 family endonuclease
MVTPIQIPPQLQHGARMSAEEFDAHPEHDGGYIELIEGVVFMVGGASVEHQRLLRKLFLYLNDLVKTGEWFSAPLTLELEGNNRPEPDIFWIAPQTAVTFEHARVIGAPTLIIEILSTSTGKQDKTTKYDVYERNGVREYWLADPNMGTIDVYILRDGKYARLGTYGEGDSFESPSLGAAVTLTGIFEPT